MISVIIERHFLQHHPLSGPRGRRKGAMRELNSRFYGTGRRGFSVCEGAIRGAYPTGVCLHIPGLLFKRVDVEYLDALSWNLGIAGSECDCWKKN